MTVKAVLMLESCVLQVTVRLQESELLDTLNQSTNTLTGDTGAE